MIFERFVCEVVVAVGAFEVFIAYVLNIQFATFWLVVVFAMDCPMAFGSPTCFVDICNCAFRKT